MPEPTRKEHLAWCKERALAYIASGEPDKAFTSMMSDLRKHPETADHTAIQLGAQLYFAGHLNSPIKMRQFIEDFN